MAKPRSTPTAAAFELPEAQPLTNFDPFALAKQFDALRVGNTAAGPAPFEMPVPKPIEYGGSLPGPAAPLPGRPAPRNAKAPASPGWSGGASDWGSKTQQFQKAMGGALRHTSGYRDPARNARTPGAAKNSYHMQRDAHGNARANDYAGSSKDMQRGAALAKQMGAKEVLVHNAGTGMHLHVAW